MAAHDAGGPLQRLSALGQSVWIDNLSRESIRGGHLQKLIDDYAVVGATSNPTIFEKAMTSGDAYDEALNDLTAKGVDANQAFWTLAEEDVREACDVFRPVWEATEHRDGYVSLEVDPRLAYDTLRTFREAIRLHEEVDKPNLLVKIPATRPGLAAIEDAIAKGRSINVTLIFSLRRYEEVAESYIRGIERLVAEGGDPSKVASVASFFVSRIDTEADKRLEEIGGHDDLRGKLAVANAKLAYRHYLEKFAGERWEFLRQQGRDGAARAVGVHVHEGPLLPRHQVRARPRGAGNGQHDARGDDPRVPGPRRARAVPGQGDRGGRARVRGTARRGRGLRRGHRHAGARGRGEILGVVRSADRLAARQAGVARPRLMAGAAACPSRASQAAPAQL